jgi:hypothetical protein
MSEKSADAWIKRYDKWGPSVYEYHVSGHFMDGYDEGYKSALEEAANLIEDDCKSVEPEDYFAWKLAQKIRKRMDILLSSANSALEKKP